MKPRVSLFRDLAVAAAFIAVLQASPACADEPGASSPAPSSASETRATRPEGWYAGVTAGVALPSGLPNRSFTIVTPAAVTGVTQGYELSSGLSLGAQVGYEFKRFRLEGEFLYQNMSRQATTVANRPVGGIPTTTSYGSAQLDTYSGFVNGYYDFNRNKKWSPFLGVGIGFTNVNSSQAARNQLVTVETPGVSDTVFAYQAKAGISYNVNEKTSLFLQYRYMGTAGFTYGGARVTAGGNVVNVSGISNGLSNSSVELGGRFKF